MVLSTKITIAAILCRVPDIGGQIYYRGRLVIPPDDPDIQFQIVYQTHTFSLAGHLGQDKTLDLVSRYY
jgi:hypothetical protein